MAPLMLMVSTADAQSYPNKPIRLMVPFPPGGSTNVMARSLAAALSKSLGQAVIVGSTPDQFRACVKAESEKWGKAVKASGASVD